MSDFSPAEIVRQLLVDTGHGSVAGTWPVFVSFMPDEPDAALCVYDTAGEMDGRLMHNGEQIEHPGIQVRVRSGLYPEAWNKARAVAIALDNVHKNIVAMSSEDAYLVSNASRRGAVIPLGMEMEGSRRRYDFTVNAVLTLKRQ